MELSNKMTNEILEKYGDDPVKLCLDWLVEAGKSEINDPEAACLATCNKELQPSSRMMLIKEISDRGFKFHTNEESQKGQDLAENDKATMCFYWKSTQKQIQVSGIVSQVSDEETDAYFATRNKESRIGAWASQQSRPFEKREEMENRIKKYADQFEEVDDIPRPHYWKGYLLVPNSIEFWVAHKDRLHTRFVYTLQPDNTWSATWLCP